MYANVGYGKKTDYRQRKGAISSGREQSEGEETKLAAILLLLLLLSFQKDSPCRTDTSRLADFTSKERETGRGLQQYLSCMNDMVLLLVASIKVNPRV